MRLFTKHINLFSYTFTFFFFVANAGFTTILHYCCEDETEDEIVHEVAATADEHSHHDDECTPLTCDGQCITDPGDGCHRQVLAGGLDDLWMFVEKSQTTAFSKANLFQVIALAIVIPASATQRLCSSFFFRERAFPPPLEKYVLNETFLI